LNSGFGDLIFFEFIIQRGAADPEATGRQFFVPVAFFQGILKQANFIFLNRSDRFIGNQANKIVMIGGRSETSIRLNASVASVHFVARMEYTTIRYRFEKRFSIKKG